MLCYLLLLNSGSHLFLKGYWIFAGGIGRGVGGKAESEWNQMHLQLPPLTQGPPFSSLAYPARHDFHFLDFFQAHFMCFFFPLTTSVFNEYANIMVPWLGTKS